MHYLTMLPRVVWGNHSYYSYAHRQGEKGTGMSSNLPKIIQQGGGTAKIQTQDFLTSSLHLYTPLTLFLQTDMQTSGGFC